MVIKFYKGPLHNKKREVPDGQTAIVCARPLPVKDWQADTVDPLAFEFGRGYYYITRHSHPDGSIFFEWAGWK